MDDQKGGDPMPTVSSQHVHRECGQQAAPDVGRENCTGWKLVN